MVNKDISTLLPHYTIDILQCTYTKARRGARPVDDNVVENMQFNLVSSKLWAIFSTEHMLNYLYKGDASGLTGGKLLSEMAFIAPMATHIQCKAGKAIAVKWIAINMKKQLKGQILDADMECVTQK